MFGKMENGINNKKRLIKKIKMKKKNSKKNKEKKERNPVCTIS